MIEVPGHAPLPVDVAFGGMTHVLVDAAYFGFEAVPSEGRALCGVGQAVKRAAAEQIPVSHPEFAGIKQTLFGSPAVREQGNLHSGNAVVVSPGRIDRCPCGTGPSALHARGRISVGQPFLCRSLIGSAFSSEITDLVRVGPDEAVVTGMSGRACATASSRPTIPLRPATVSPIRGRWTGTVRSVGRHDPREIHGSSLDVGQGGAARVDAPARLFFAGTIAGVMSLGGDVVCLVHSPIGALDVVRARCASIQKPGAWTMPLPAAAGEGAGQGLYRGLCAGARSCCGIEIKHVRLLRGALTTHLS